MLVAVISKEKNKIEFNLIVKQDIIRIKKVHALIVIIYFFNTESSMDMSLTNESAWTYFSGKDGSKSEYFRDHYWPPYLLFGILAIGALCNIFLVSASNYHVKEY